MHMRWCRKYSRPRHMQQMKMRVNLGVFAVLLKSSECQLVAHEVSRYQWWLEENTNIMNCNKLFISHVTLLLMMKRVSLPMACV